MLNTPSFWCLDRPFPMPGLKMEEEGGEILMKDWAANGAVVGVWHYVGRLDLGPGVSDWVPMTADGECVATSKIGRVGLETLDLE